MLMVTGQNKDLVTGCRLERIRKETTSEMKVVINSKHRVHRRYLNLCSHSRGHGKAAKRCARNYGVVRNANQCEENVFVGDRQG